MDVEISSKSISRVRSPFRGFENGFLLWHIVLVLWKTSPNLSTLWGKIWKIVQVLKMVGWLYLPQGLKLLVLRSSNVNVLWALITALVAKIPEFGTFFFFIFAALWKVHCSRFGCTNLATNFILRWLGKPHHHHQLGM